MSISEKFNSGNVSVLLNVGSHHLFVLVSTTCRLHTNGLASYMEQQPSYKKGHGVPWKFSADENNFFLDNFKESNIDDLEKEANEKASEVLKHFEIINFLKSKINY